MDGATTLQGSRLRAHAARFLIALAAALLPLMNAYHWHPSLGDLWAALPGALWVAVEETAARRSPTAPPPHT